MKTIDISLLKKSSDIRAGYFDFKIYTETISESDRKMLQNDSVFDMTIDLKNKTVVLDLVELKSVDFYKFLRNFLASKDAKLYITSKRPVYDGTNKSYETAYPNIYLYDGSVVEHKLNTNIREDVVCSHQVKIKFAKIDHRYNDKTMF